MSILKASWDNATSPERVELVFENRNKNYGAFVLRTTYNKTMLTAFLIAVSAIVLAFYLPAIINALTPKEDEDAMVKKITEAKLMEPPPMDEKKPPPPPPEIKLPELKQVNFTPPVIKPDEEVDQEVAEIEEIKTAVIGTQDVEGDTVSYDAPIENAVIEEEQAPLLIVEQMPEFPGGVEKMMEFIQKNLVYPPLAKENGIEGRVVLSFVVNSDGSIVDIKPLKKIGWGCEEAAIDVVKRMPGWKAGKQNGKAVRFQFNLPFLFQLR